MFWCSSCSSGSAAFALRTRLSALNPNQTAAISTTRTSSFIGLNMSYAPVAPRGVEPATAGTPPFLAAL